MGWRRAARWAGRALLVLAALLGLLAVIGYRSARADPAVRRTVVRLPHWPAGAPPVTVALLSDIHIGSPATDDARLRRVVGQVNALRPSLILIAGDFVAGEDPARGRKYARELTAPLAQLRAPLGVVAVMGNHDHWTALAEIGAALRAANITVLMNEATTRGPLAVLGIDDGFSEHADVARTLASARGLNGARLVLTHTPDTAIGLSPKTGALLLAGHTHCGQDVLPWIGQLSLPGDHRTFYTPRYQCGLVRDPGRLVVVTGGIGGSLPLRYGAPPDLWLLTLGP